MIETRAKVAQLQTLAQRMTERLPFLHQAFVGSMLSTLFSIVDDLVREVEQLQHGERGRLLDSKPHREGTEQCQAEKQDRMNA